FQAELLSVEVSLDSDSQDSWKQNGGPVHSCKSLTSLKSSECLVNISTENSPASLPVGVAPNLNNRPMTISLQPIKSTLSDQTPLMSSTPNYFTVAHEKQRPG
uniref:Uncharacterized protein n=1 Tax=Maylandia zebra TaxID=106582 RepID=A0A3P9CBY3_9CICH